MPRQSWPNLLRPKTLNPDEPRHEELVALAKLNDVKDEGTGFVEFKRAHLVSLKRLVGRLMGNG